jgi:hypothetical protein
VYQDFARKLRNALIGVFKGEGRVLLLFEIYLCCVIYERTAITLQQPKTYKFNLSGKIYLISHRDQNFLPTFLIEFDIIEFGIISYSIWKILVMGDLCRQWVQDTCTKS